MRTPRPSFVVLTLFAPVLAACGGDGPFGPGGVFSISVPFDYTLDATGRTGLRLTGVNGTIVIAGQSVDESVMIQGFRRVRDCGRSSAEELIDQLEVDVQETATEIVVQTIQPNLTAPCSLIVDYELTVPGRLVGQVVNINGTITVDDLSEGIDVTNVNGNIDLRDVEGETTVRLTNGSIDAGLRIEGTEEIDLLTVNGEIDLTVPTTTDADLSIALANGTIRVTNLTVANQTITPVSLTGTLGTGVGAIILRTTNGDITIRGN